MTVFGRKPTTRSLLDEDSERAAAARSTADRRAVRRRRGTAGLALVLAAAVGVVIVGHRTSAPGSQLSTFTLQRGSGAPVTGGAPQALSSGATAPVDLLIDGWSAHILGSALLTATVDGHEPQPLTLTPITQATLTELLATTPDLVTAALARQVTDDPTLSCSATGCRTAHGPLDPRVLLHPGTAAGVGAELRGYGITSGLLIAQVNLPDGAGAVTISAPGAGSYTVAGIPLADLDTVDSAVTPTLANGFLRSRWLMGAGLGQLFTDDPAWLRSAPADPTLEIAPAAAPAPVDVATELSATLPTITAVHGLTQSLPAAAAWTDTQLTDATSPSTGCIPGIVCAPTTVAAAVSSLTSAPGTVCSAGARDGVDVVDVTARVTLPAPTAQAGVGVLTGSPTVRFVVAGLFDGSPLVDRDQAGHTTVNGPPATYSLPDVLSHVRLAGTRWTACS
jgi:hypothetical protein